MEKAKNPVPAWLVGGPSIGEAAACAAEAMAAFGEEVRAWDGAVVQFWSRRRIAFYIGGRDRQAQKVRAKLRKWRKQRRGY